MTNKKEGLVVLITALIGVLLILIISAMLFSDNTAKITGYTTYTASFESSAEKIKKNLEQEPVAAYIQDASTKFNVDINLIRAVIAKESSGVHLNLDGTTKHSRCCWGIMQVGESAFEQVKAQTGLNSFNEITCPSKQCIKNNIMTGTAYLNWLTGVCNKDMDCTIASYNAGVGCYRQGPVCKNYDFAVNTYLPSVKNYYAYFGGTKFKTIPAGNLEYYLKPSFKTEIDYNLFKIYDELKSKVEAGKKAVIECLKKGSGKAGDNDVEDCSKRYGITGVDKRGEYYLKFDFDEEPPASFSSKEKIHYKIALLLEDNIPPPMVFLTQLIEDNPIKMGFRITSYASDTAGYKIYCKKGSGQWEQLDKFTAEEEVLEKEYALCGNEEGNYCFGAIAFDEVDNKIGDIPDIQFELGTNMACENIKRKCCKKGDTFQFGTIEGCPVGSTETGYEKCAPAPS